MIEIIQGSPEWFEVRRGKVTASRVPDLVARTKSGWGASRVNYMAELIAERLTDTTATSFSNAAMQWGTETEPQARAAYEFRHDCDVTEVGFVEHPRVAMSGASPDGLIGDAGLVEIKCPNTATHIDTLMGQSVPSKYIIQMQWQMACTGREWCDFVSFDPRMPESMRLFVKRVARDEHEIMSLEKEVGLFLIELAAKVATLKREYERQEAA